MQIGWQIAGPKGERIYSPPQLMVPARFNFNQGCTYLLKLTNIPGRPNASLYPSIQVAQSTPATEAYLAHNMIAVQFTPEDFDQVMDGGNFVTKVIYLPDRENQELAISGVEAMASTRLEPGTDPVLEAGRRGTILLVLRSVASTASRRPRRRAPQARRRSLRPIRARACRRRVALARLPLPRHRER